MMPLTALIALALLLCHHGLGDASPVPTPMKGREGNRNHDLDLDLRLGLGSIDTSTRRHRLHDTGQSEQHLLSRPQTARAPSAHNLSDLSRYSSRTARAQDDNAYYTDPTGRFLRQRSNLLTDSNQGHFDHHQSDIGQSSHGQSGHASDQYYPGYGSTQPAYSNEGAHLYGGQYHDFFDKGESSGQYHAPSHASGSQGGAGMDPDLFRQFQQAFEGHHGSRGGPTSPHVPFPSGTGTKGQFGIDQLYNNTHDMHISTDYVNQSQTNEEGQATRDRTRRARKPRVQKPRSQNTGQYEAYLAGYFQTLVEELHSRLPYDNEGRYLRPYEYTLRVSRDVQRRPDLTLYGSMARTNQGAYVTELIEEIRPYSSEAIHHKLKLKLSSESTAKQLLSDKKRVAEAAVNTIFEKDVRKKGSREENWMFGLSNNKRRKVMNLLADDTNIAKNKLRHAFLTHEVQPATAKAILKAKNRDARLRIFSKLNLAIPGDEVYSNCYKGLSGIQRAALLQRMMNHISESYARIMVSEKYVPVGFGKVLLRARDAQFNHIMDVWRRDARRPIPEEEDRRGRYDEVNDDEWDIADSSDEERL